MSARWLYLCGLASTALLAGFVGAGVSRTGTDNGWKQHDIHRPKPPVVEPQSGLVSATPPKDAVVLLGGASLDAWQSASGGPAAWKLTDGVMEIVPGAGAIRTKGKFGDVQLHVEWASPNPANGTGQDRGNTGLFLMRRYELQILDSYKADTYADGQAGAIYGQYPPLFNASRPPGEWQTYDIAFRRPRFDESGKLVEPARMTVIHNGVVVQDNEELLGQTNWLKWTPYEAHGEADSIELQDHGHPVRFRNMWLRNLPERAAPTAESLKGPEIVKLSNEALDKFTGRYVMGTNRNGTRVTITRADGHLLVKLSFLPQPLVIEPTSPTTFAMPHTDGRFSFKEEGGKVTGAKFEIGDGERTIQKIEP
jgi:Domain of Unknown Function (DUF1080)